MENSNAPTAPRFVIFGQEGGHPNYRQNQKLLYKGRHVDVSECCVYCGKPTPTAKFSVYLNTDNEPIEQRDDQYDLGYYPIGSDCKRLALAAGVPVYNTVTQERVRR